MPAYAIMRMEKIKSRRSLFGRVQHNSRERMPLNADPDRTKGNFFEGSSQSVMAKYSDLLPAKVRKDAVHAIEVVATASEGWFEGRSSKDCIDFYQRAIKWASGFFGKENIISTAIHMDEKTPHVHLIAMPLVDGKLNAKALIGGTKHRMHDLQDEFYELVGKPLAMDRGEKRAVRHTETKEFARVMKEQKAALEAREGVLNAREKEFKAVMGLTPAQVRESVERLNTWRSQSPKQLRDIAAEYDKRGAKDCYDLDRILAAELKKGRGR